MKPTLVTTLLNDFNKMDRDAQRKHLQLFEYYCARHFNRPARDVVYEELIDPNTKKSGFYDLFSPAHINIFYTNNPLEALTTVFHEGYHAYIDDFISDRINKLRAISKVDRTKLYFERIHNIEIAKKTIGKYSEYIRLDKYEESLTRTETDLNLLTAIMVACETEEDIKEQFKYYKTLLNNAFLIKRYIEKSEASSPKNYKMIIKQLCDKYQYQQQSLEDYIASHHNAIVDEENTKLADMYSKGKEQFEQIVDCTSKKIDCSNTQKVLMNDFKHMTYEMINMNKG